jgi:glycosyltransferase involved in cell wall biosynthesis
MSNQARVLLVTEDLALPIDEGLKKFVTSVSAALGALVPLEVVVTQPSGPVADGVTIARANLAMAGRELKKTLEMSKPSHVVYFPRSGGTRNAFIRGAMLARHCPGARMSMVILQSRQYDRISAAIVRRLRFETILAQGPTVREELARIGVTAQDLPSGVDLVRFSPARSQQERVAARAMLGVPVDSPLLLHVGHIKHDRNVLLLARLRQELGCSVAVIGSTATVQEIPVREQLEAAGVTVITRYLDNIADAYRAADWYVFPVHEAGNAIEMPLSVLEALACGTPVVTTPFGSLPDWLESGPAVRYATDDDDLVDTLRTVMAGDRPPVDVVRQAAESFSWPAIAQRLAAAIELDVPVHVSTAGSRTPIAIPA